VRSSPRRGTRTPCRRSKAAIPTPTTAITSLRTSSRCSHAFNTRWARQCNSRTSP
jgi:hypothetical protein